MRRLYTWLSVFVLAALLFLAVAPAPASAAPAATAGGPGCQQFYTIQRGDTLYRIAVRFHTTVSALARLNGISNPNYIVAGRTICVVPGEEVPFGFLYQVRWGDTLYSIARRYGWSYSYLAAVNHLANPNRIVAGQILLIPYH